jgi:hypothetical protein
MPPPNPHRLSRDQMHAIIDAGESVMLPDGRIISQKAALPGEGEVALMTGDTARAAAAEDDLEVRIATDKAHLDVLRQRRQDQEKAAAAAPRAHAPAPADEAARDAERQALLAGNPPAPPPASTIAPNPAGIQAQAGKADEARPKGK